MDELLHDQSWAIVKPRDREGGVVRCQLHGKQLGRISDAVLVLLRHVDLGKLSHEEDAAIRDLKSMLHEIFNKKVAHGARLVLRP